MKPDFLHQCCIYGSDAEFLAMAVPFVRDGLHRGEPVLVTTTSANLELLHDVMGTEAGKIDYAESAYFGRRPPQRTTAIHRYWERNQPTTPTGAVRILAEPVWAGRSRREVASWKHMEAAFNVVLADTGIRMICPYDTRGVGEDIIENARRTHPECVVGHRAEPSAHFVAPEELARPRTSPRPLRGATGLFRFEGDLTATRRYVLETAAALLVSEDAVAMFGIAVGEAITYLVNQGIDRAVVWVRSAAGRVVCTLHSEQPLDTVHPFLGYRPPGLSERPGDGLWLTNQICEWLDVSSDASGCTIELAMPGRRAEEIRHGESSRLAFGA
ncbi:MEDS domain-containing protein [Allokutzneria albata]|uniref:MEDS: MEthanogen/methylotroph, DcmR Sensory domain n=1 Tax=Allokutzneria albata TaxID=211114 RepID=A0A1G9WDZ5_ALLAB|nr:MEDS domain-containing protein [Allokutzneria albata]SDM82245.1 MEDS: MEthanogen/methylotroph, DcmR Sensory domain [Allokutzneria albata]